VELIEAGPDDAIRREAGKMFPELDFDAAHQDFAGFVLVTDHALVVRHHHAG
jgi:hypothetical protein